MIGTMMVVTGMWNKAGVDNVEEFDPDPYMEALNKWGLPWVVEENPQLVKAMGGLGGGIGYCGDTCGCLTGSACAIGYFLGNLAPEEKEDAQMKPAVQEVYQWFRQKTEEEFGAFYCKDITHLDWGVIMEKCPGLIADTYTKVMEILTEREVLKL